MKRTFGLFALAAFALVGCNNAEGMSIPEFSWKGDGASESMHQSGEDSQPDTSVSSSAEEGPTWSKQIQDAMQDTIHCVLPYFGGFEESSFYFENYPEDDEYYAYFLLADASATDIISESNYDEILEASGFELVELDGYYGYGLEIEDGEQLVYVEYGYDSEDPGNYIAATLYSDYGGGGEVDIDLDPSKFLPGDTMTFDNEDYMISKGTEISYWAVGTNVMVVEQGDSTQTVGNGNYYSNPLRVYSGQIISFLFLGDVPSSVVINCASNAYALKLDGNVEGATATVSESNITFVPDADVQGFSVAPSAQTRLNSVHFVA